MTRTTTRLRDALIGLVTAAALALAGAPAAGAADDVPTEPDAATSISGTVVFPEGLGEDESSQGAAVTATSVDGWSYGQTWVLGTDFVITGLEAGRDYLVTVSPSHYALGWGYWVGNEQQTSRLRSTATPVAAGTTGLVIRPQQEQDPTVISGTIVLPTGVASADGTRVVASTRFVDPDDNPPPTTAVVSGSAFTLTGLNPYFSYQICLEASAGTLSGCYSTDEQPLDSFDEQSGSRVNAGTDDLVLRPAKAYTMTGTVVLPAGVTSLDGLQISAEADYDWAAPYLGSTTLSGTTFAISGLSEYVSYRLHVTGSSTVLDGYYAGPDRPLVADVDDAWYVFGGQSSIVLRPESTLRAAPTSTTKPTVTGTVKVGATLTAKPGTWSVAGTTPAYQWLRNGTAIGGATKSTYKVAAADAGTKLSVRVTASKTGYASGQATSASTATVAFLTFTSTTKPTVTGTARVGAKLTAKPGTWSVSGLTYSYQWLRGGAAISGATSSTYTATASDAGTKLAVKVVARRTGYANLSATSAATGVVAKGVITNRTKPAVSGSVKVGGTLTVKPGTWSPSTPTLRYQWLRGGKAIAGATAATYTPVAADLGQRLSVKVTASRSGYTTVSATSAATGAVARGTITSTARPTITGTAAVASRLTAGSGTWSTTGLTLGYQWLRDGTTITGATSSAYTPVAGDLGKKLTVRVTAKKNGYTSATATSIATAAVAKATATP